MKKYEFKKIVTREEPIIYGYNGLMQLGDEYLLTNSGILVDNEGNLVWEARWKHYFFDAIYIKDKQILITNRTIDFGMGGHYHLGIACIDMKTGDYKWRHFYDGPIAKLYARKEEPDINNIGRLGIIDLEENSIITEGFKINIENGSFMYLGESEIEVKENEQIIRARNSRSLKEWLHSNSENTSIIDIRIDKIAINDTEYSEKGYFFNKCDFIVSSSDFIYFWGIPAKRNPNNTIMFKYSKELDKIDDEIEMPFRYAPIEVYEFFNKGILFIVGKTIWLFKDFRF